MLNVTRHAKIQPEKGGNNCTFEILFTSCGTAAITDCGIKLFLDWKDKINILFEDSHYFLEEKPPN